MGMRLQILFIQILFLKTFLIPRIFISNQLKIDERAEPPCTAPTNYNLVGSSTYDVEEQWEKEGVNCSCNGLCWQHRMCFAIHKEEEVRENSFSF